jgi:hypothetical protein
MTGTTLLLPLYSPHIHSFLVRGFPVLKGLQLSVHASSPCPHIHCHPLLHEARRGDAGAFCPKRPRSFFMHPGARQRLRPFSTLFHSPTMGTHAGELAGCGECTHTTTHTYWHMHGFHALTHTRTQAQAHAYALAYTRTKARTEMPHTVTHA